jgi:prophage regulatory protein
MGCRSTSLRLSARDLRLVLLTACSCLNWEQVHRHKSENLKETLMSEKTSPTMSVLRRPEVQSRTGLSRSSIYKMVKDSTFPKPVSLGARAIGWRDRDIDQWLENRPVKI